MKTLKSVTWTTLDPRSFLLSLISLGSLIRKYMARRFHPRRMTERHVLMAEQLWSDCVKRLQQKAPRIREYEKFCRSNGLDPRQIPSSLVYYVAHARSDGLGPRTIRRYVTGHYSGPSAGSDLVVSFKELLAQLHLEGIKVPRRHAEDFDEHSIFTMLRKLGDRNAWGCVVACMMCWTGLRYIDLQYLASEDIRITDTTLFIDVRRTKAIRTEIQRTELSLPRRLWPEPIFEALLVVTGRWIKDKRTSTVAPVGTNATELNNLLHEVWEELGQAGRHPTTYTLRRFAFHRFIEGCRNAHQSVNWKKVASYTLHMDERTARAFTIWEQQDNNQKRSVAE